MAKFNATSVYAFVAWIASMVVFVVFILWAFSPRSFFHEIGITYYPSRYYAIALPAYIIVVLFIIIMSYIGINLMMTLEPDDMFTIKDNQTRSSPNTFMKCSTLGGTNVDFANLNSELQISHFVTAYHPCLTLVGIPDIGDIDPIDISYLIFNQDEKKIASTAKIRKALS